MKKVFDNYLNELNKNSDKYFIKCYIWLNHCINNNGFIPLVKKFINSNDNNNNI